MSLDHKTNVYGFISKFRSPIITKLCRLEVLRALTLYCGEYTSLPQCYMTSVYSFASIFAIPLTIKFDRAIEQHALHLPCR